VPDIFVSCTRSDRDWGRWIATGSRAPGHASHMREWEIGPRSCLGPGRGPPATNR